MEKKNVKKVSNIPYSNKYLVDELKSCLTPLLKKKEIVEKWSPEIPQYIELSANNGVFCDKDNIERIEDYLFSDVDTSTYINRFKTIYDSLVKLSGNLLIKNYSSEKLISKIKDNINVMYDFRWELDSWLICEAEHYHSEDFVDLCNDVTAIKEKLDNICDNNNKINIDLDIIPYYIQQNINKIKSIYEKILKLTETIFALEDTDKIYPYKNTLKKFAQNLSNELVYMAGELYLDVEKDINIYSRVKEKVEKYFKKLEKTYINGGQKLEYIFYDLSKNNNHGTTTDKILLYAYQELKAATNIMIMSYWS